MTILAVLIGVSVMLGVGAAAIDLWVKPKHVHAFSKWAEIKQGKILSSDHIPPGSWVLGNPEWREVGVFMIQQRTCDECGFTELNHQKVRVAK